MDKLSFTVLTVSDSCFEKKAEDLSGPCLQQLVLETFPNVQIYKEIVPDDQNTIEQALRKYSDEIKTQAVFTTGGTGFAPRDVTPEATKNVIHRECPQLTLAMALESFKKTPFASLSRAVCGIRNRTLIVNLPGSVKAVRECFGTIRSVLPHALQLIGDDKANVRQLHQEIQSPIGHVCPHKTGSGDKNDRNSPYPMIPVQDALELILKMVSQRPDNNTFQELNYESPIDVPPFRASIKDGYAMKSRGFSGTKKVVGTVSAGDQVSEYELEDDECFKINTGAPIPQSADCVIQIEDTKLLKTKKNGEEDLVEILVEPKLNLDIRPIGSDIKMSSRLFPKADKSDVTIKSMLAFVGQLAKLNKPRIALISIGNELLPPDATSQGPPRIYDSNRTMLKELLKYFGFDVVKEVLLEDDLGVLTSSLEAMLPLVDIVVCTGGVSMGDKDFIKPALKSLPGFDIHFGRVNMKPGKPMTFASHTSGKYFFGLPGNPVSAFVTFHLFVLPALRKFDLWSRDKCELAKIRVVLENSRIDLDPRPEFARASITSRNGQLFASVTGNQISSRLQSIVGADVLLHLPGRTEEKTFVAAGEVLTASVLRYDFISKYE